MSDISDVISADGAHILCWQARLGRLRDAASGPDLTATWDTVAALIELHMRAGQEICDPVIYRAGPRGWAQAGQVRAVRRDIAEILRETALQPPGSRQWWRLAAAALAAWALHFDEEQHGPPADYRRRADRGLREHLARQWRAFAEAAIQDLSYPAAPLHLPTCQLRLAHPATPRLAHPAFCPLACTCRSCTERLGRRPARGAATARDADGPALHAHVVLGLADGTTRGGHLLEGWVFPTLEVVVTEAPAELRKVMRPDLGIALIDLDQSGS